MLITEPPVINPLQQARYISLINILKEKKTIVGFPLLF